MVMISTTAVDEKAIRQSWNIFCSVGVFILLLGHFSSSVVVCVHGSSDTTTGTDSVVDMTTDGTSFVCTKDGKKCDTHVRCPIWKEDGECVRSQSYMATHCPGSCENVRATEIKESTDDLSNGTCRDRHDDCSVWATLGECDSNPDMKRYCAVSCGICELEPATSDDGIGTDLTCIDENESCGFWAGAGECDANPNYMHQFCKKSCKVCNSKVPVLKKIAKTTSRKETSDEQEQTKSFGVLQSVEGAKKDDALKRVIESIAYMASDTVVELDESIRAKCQNRHELCAFWAVIGECEKNAAYMKTNCAPSCMTCHLIDINQRCPKLGDEVEAALYPGDLNKMFTRIIRRAPGNRTDLTDDERKVFIESNTPIYTVHVHSQPESDVTEISAAYDKSSPPWVIRLDNFVSDEECETMIQLGYKYEYKISKDVGAEKFDGSHEGVQSERRTSENAWCSRMQGCRNETIPTRLHQRIADVLGIPPENSEDFQVLKYEVGQF
jgi:prolyl 4-hydroxylase